MSNKFSLKFNIFDIIIISISLIITSILSVFFLIKDNNSTDEKIIQIQYQNTIIKELDFNSYTETSYYTISAKEYDLYDDNDFVIEINPDKGVCVHEVSCPNNYCKHQGYVNKIGYPIVCVPNAIIICMISKTIDEPFIIG